MLAIFPHNGFSQGTGKNQTIFTLSPLLSVTSKIYVLNESDLRKYQLPQNYMIVRNPAKETITLWEFPNEFPVDQAKPLPKDTPNNLSEKTIQEKPKTADEQRSLAEPGQMIKLLKSLGLGSGKEISIHDLNQLLTDVNIK